MKKTPRVSIGLPVFNGQDFLEDTLDSILCQIYSDFELIICDNASTDRTGEICRDYAARDSRIRYYCNEKNLGAAPNYNRTFYLSQGEYFKWAAHDDLIVPEFLSKCVDTLDTNSEAVLCFTGAKVIDEDSKVIQFDSFKANIHSQHPHIKYRNVLLDTSAAPQVPLLVFGLIRSEILRRSGLIRNFPNSDVVLAAELALYGSFVELPEPLFLWRQHPDQSIKGELASDRNRTLWFDTSLENKVVMHKWMNLGGYLDAVNGASINSYEKLLCYLLTVRWSLRLSNFKSLVKDVLLAARATQLRLFRKPGSAAATE